MSTKPIKAWAVVDSDGPTIWGVYFRRQHAANAWPSSLAMGTKRIVRVTITIDEPKRRKGARK